MIYKLIWKYLKNGLIEYYLKDQNKPVELTQLEYAFTDKKGKKYYRFGTGVSLPIDRYAQLTKYLTLTTAKLTASNIDDITNKMLEMIQAGIDKNKNAAKIAALCYELQDREKWIVPHQLIYDILCVQYVREDEQPEVFSKDIHMEKVSTFMDDISKHSFFLTIPELKKLINSSTMSEDEWTNYCQKSMEQDESLKEILKIISSKK